MQPRRLGALATFQRLELGAVMSAALPQRGESVGFWFSFDAPTSLSHRRDDHLGGRLAAMTFAGGQNRQRS
jgi:hypothetical protein